MFLGRGVVLGELSEVGGGGVVFLNGVYGLARPTENTGRSPGSGCIPYRCGEFIEHILPGGAAKTNKEKFPLYNTPSVHILHMYSECKRSLGLFICCS